MLHARSADGVKVWAPAKVNLFLEVLRKRADGYHEIATLMVAVSLFDTLEFKEEPSGAIQLICDQPGLSTGPDNLVCRAAELLRQSGGGQGARIVLTKRIPLAAGLGGGSSDAAATLEGLNRLWRLGHSSAELADLGAQLGSDVPFFFAAPAAWCSGRGEIVTPVTLGRRLDFVLACPAAGLSTAAVYGGVSIPEQPLAGAELRQAAADGDVAAIGRRLHNRLQPVAERICPEVAECRALLSGFGPAGALMSGSGSSVFALCRDRREAVRIVRGLRRSGQPALRLFIVRSCV